MNKTLPLLVATLLPMLAQAQPETWEFMRSVGGLAIGQPQRQEQGWVLPVRADLSGLQASSETPHALNSALACERIDAVVARSGIFLTVISGLAGPGRSSRCPAASLGAVGAGRYAVFYRGGDAAAQVRLGEIDIPP